MNIDDKHKALHAYFTRASSIREVLMRMPQVFDATHGAAAPESLRPMLLAFEAHNVLAVFYGLMFVVIEGLQDCNVKDEKLEELFASEHLDRFRRFRNAIFHFQPTFPVSAKQFDFMVEADSEKWAQSVWRELNRWFSNNVARPVLAQHAAADDEK